MNLKEAGEIAKDFMARTSAQDNGLPTAAEADRGGLIKLEQPEPTDADVQAMLEDNVSQRSSPSTIRLK